MNLFYNDIYIKLNKFKSEKLKIKNLSNDNIEYTFEENFISHEYMNKIQKTIDTDYNTQDRLNFILLRKYQRKFYVFTKYKDHKFNNYGYDCLSCSANNYFIKKHGTMTTTNKNILMFNYFKLNPYNKNYDTIHHDNSIFSNYGFFLFNNAVNCNIYEIIDIENNDVYNEKIINNHNNNTHNFVTYNTDGNVYNKKTMDIVLDRLKNVQFDIIISSHQLVKYGLMYNNINIILMDMYIISRISNINTIVFYLYYQNHDLSLYNNYNYIQPIIIFKNLFKYILLSNNLFYPFSYTVKLTKIDKKSKIYMDFENIINKILIDKLTITFDSKKTNYKDINMFIQNIDLIKKDKSNNLLKMLLLSEKNHIIYKIIEENIKDMQIKMFRKKKYKKYLLPY